MKKQQQNQSKNNHRQAMRKKYSKPELLPLGDIRDVTMGGSPGLGDSGPGSPEKPF